MDDLRVLGPGEPVLHGGEGFVCDVVGGDARWAGFGGNLDAEDARAETFFVRVLRVESKPRSCFLLGRNRVEILFESRRRLDRRVVRLLSVGERRELAQQRSETQLGVEFAKRGGIR